MKTIMLGHNPFFGVHHGSSMAGMERSLRFQDPRAIVSFVERAHEAGIHDMMLSTHPMAEQMRDVIVRNDNALREEMTFHPLLPYMQKYVRMANEEGILPMVGKLVSNMGLRQTASVFLRTAVSKIFNDPKGIIKSLIAMEMGTFEGLRCGRVFLHNAVTDLALGLNTREPLVIFKEFVHKHFGADVGFGTLNLPYALDRFHEWGMPDEYFMAPFNAVSHQMNPDLESNIDALQRFPNSRLLAMSTLASGTITPEKAYAFLAGFRNVDSVVVGISSEKHLKGTVEAITRFWHK